MFEKFSFDPGADFKNYREALRQILEGGWVLPRDLMPTAMNAIVIPVDVLDNGPELVIKASLPGVKPDGVSITIVKETLTIKAAVSDDENLKGATYLRHERQAAMFTRTLTLPMPVMAEKADARFKNGVLILTLPKSGSIRPRIVQVSSE